MGQGGHRSTIIDDDRRRIMTTLPKDFFLVKGGTIGIQTLIHFLHDFVNDIARFISSQSNNE